MKTTQERIDEGISTLLYEIYGHLSDCSYEQKLQRERVQQYLTTYSQKLVEATREEIDLVGKYAEKAMFLKSREVDEANYPFIKKLTDEEYTSFRDVLRQSLTQYHQALMSEVVEKCINEVNHYRATPRLRRDFCEWCDEVLLPGDKCDCKIETVRQELMDLINMDLEALTEAQNVIKNLTRE